MEKINFNYSLKNIPISSKSSYQLKLIDKIKRMRWKAHFFMSSNVIECYKESFGFKSKNCPAQIKELEAFEKNLLDIVKSIKFRNINNKTVCFYHVTYAFQSESTLYSCLNVKELLARSRREI